ncbi:MAG: preprotein translocase subunit YajC [Clostridia bacterium]|nr:preprotein translocase subunit YajC [Clostridia bacterium]
MNLTPELATYVSYGLIALMFVGFYFIAIRPSKKREKETAKMRNELDIGDSITTIGGIVARVVQVKDDDLIIETAINTRMRIKRWAVQSCDTLKDE